MSTKHWILTIALVVVLVGGPGIFWLLQRRRRRRIWREIGRELGFQPEEKEPIVRGRYHGLLATAGIMSVEGGGEYSSGESATTVVRVSLPGASTFEIVISRKTLLSRLGKLAGVEDLELDDRSFDERFVVKTSTPDVAKKLLSPTIRSALLKLDSNQPRGVVRVKNNMVYWESRFLLMDVAEVRAVLDVLVEIAEQLATVE